MGLRQWVERRAVRASRVLLVECPGAWQVRAACEGAVLRRGWRLADCPAGADVLLVAGVPDEDTQVVLERVWEAMPGPRVRVGARSEHAVDAALDDAVRDLLDLGARDDDARSRPTVPDLGDTDHDDTAMAPDGIPLAEGDPDDRDGLEMDVLPLRLGPVLPHWPPGLVVDVRLHGDLVVAGSTSWVGGGTVAAEPHPRLRAARACDDVAAVLALVGWEDATDAARTARDTLLARHGDDARATIADLRHRVARSRRLGWALRGVGYLEREAVLRAGLPGSAAGDCLDRLLVLLERADTAAREYREGADSHGGEPGQPAVVLDDLLAHQDLGVARILVASLGLRAPCKVGADA
ncbi:hypothetical protein KC207_03855 [Phycicoccus sp. BSK3Z-2]|uniref:Uncharacterized protein n=1 Tax=Phycicoccus avicenniae TaxID=2828860 RepID=A0A941D7V1_9MICO|nr:hypothetical protein [Phycicoccus avicenniae]MBR7742425.1 hypothetical protein [Phycicoccus avicenniae]